MKKIIILLLCCGVLVSMVGCGGNIASPPAENPPTTVSETIITETPTETTPTTTAAEPTEKGNEPTPTESKDQPTEQTKEATEQFQTAMETSAAELTENINRLITDTEKQVGRMSESCSHNISMLRSTAVDKLEKHTNKLFWISLIPSAVLIVLELIRHILSAISAI